VRWRQSYKEIFSCDRFRKLAAKGARVQRLLWASTSTKNPDYSDVKYVEAIIGPDTVDTAPLETLDAYRDHGEPKARLERAVKEARWMLDRLPELGISIDTVTRQLENEGVERFIEPFDTLKARWAPSSNPARPGQVLDWGAPAVQPAPNRDSAAGRPNWAECVAGDPPGGWFPYGLDDRGNCRQGQSRASLSRATTGHLPSSAG
jgi:hypothetical protein